MKLKLSLPKLGNSPKLTRIKHILLIINRINGYWDEAPNLVGGVSDELLGRVAPHCGNGDQPPDVVAGHLRPRLVVDLEQGT